MRKLMMFVALIAGLMMVASPVAAQTPAADFADVEVETIAATTLDADLDALITGMEEPMVDADLPEGFSNAEFVDPEAAGEMDLVLPTEDLEFSEGSVAYNVDYEPDTTGLAIGLSSLNYIFVDGEISEDDMDDFREGATQGLEEDTTGADVAVEDIEINGVTGVLISYELEEEGITSIVQMIALPVGNTMVLGMVVAASDDPQLNGGQILTDAENLVLAGVDHLGAVAEDAQ
jgi:hypothetical protein